MTKIEQNTVVWHFVLILWVGPIIFFLNANGIDQQVDRLSFIIPTC